MRPTRVIINADDLGVSPLANQNTFSLMAWGAVTSATLLANGPALERALDQALRTPACSFGVHLNLTAGPPLTRSPGLAPLLDGQGRFRRRHLRGVWQPRVLAAAYDELCAQVERVRQAGISPSHLDSHHHAHYHPKVLLLVKMVQRRYGIRKLRLSKNFYFVTQCSPAKLALKHGYNLLIRHVYSSRCVDWFSDLPDFYGAALTRRLPGDFELMVHPENTANQAEQALLQRPWWRDLDFPLELISYHSL